MATDKKNIQLLKDLLDAVNDAHDMADRANNIDKLLADKEKELEKKDNEIATKERRLDNLALKKAEQEKLLVDLLDNANKEAEAMKQKISLEAFAAKDKALSTAKAANTRKNGILNDIQEKEKELSDLDKKIKEYEKKLDAVKLEAKKLMDGM